MALDSRRKDPAELQSVVERTVKGLIRKAPSLGERFDLCGRSSPELGRPNLEEFCDWLASALYELYVPAQEDLVHTVALTCLVHEQVQCLRTMQPLDYTPLTTRVSLNSAVIWCGADISKAHNRSTRKSILKELAEGFQIEVRSFHYALSDAYPKVSFRQVAGFDEVIVSDDGQVFHRLRKLRAKGVRNPYRQVTITQGEKRTQPYVHQLVARGFLGEANGLQVHHIDENKWNNHISNLAYITASENVQQQKGGKRDRVLVSFDPASDYFNVYNTLATAGEQLNIQRPWLSNAITTGMQIHGRSFKDVPFVEKGERKGKLIAVTAEGENIIDVEVINTEEQGSWRLTRPANTKFAVLKYPAPSKRGRTRKAV